MAVHGSTADPRMTRLGAIVMGVYWNSRLQYCNWWSLWLQLGCSGSERFTHFPLGLVIFGICMTNGDEEDDEQSSAFTQGKEWRGEKVP